MARILVVDDDPDILETLQYALEKQGHQVCAYDDGRVALEAARSEAPEAAILDVMLPGLNGYEVSRLLKEDVDRGDLEDFPILLVTARRVVSGARQDFLLGLKENVIVGKQIPAGTGLPEFRDLMVLEKKEQEDMPEEFEDTPLEI